MQQPNTFRFLAIDPGFQAAILGPEFEPKRAITTYFMDGSNEPFYIFEDYPGSGRLARAPNVKEDYPKKIKDNIGLKLDCLGYEKMLNLAKRDVGRTTSGATVNRLAYIPGFFQKIVSNVILGDPLEESIHSEHTYTLGSLATQPFDIHRSDISAFDFSILSPFRSSDGIVKVSTNIDSGLTSIEGVPLSVTSDCYNVSALKRGSTIVSIAGFDRNQEAGLLQLAEDCNLQVIDDLDPEFFEHNLAGFCPKNQV
jgi:hypothetical protein